MDKTREELEKRAASWLEGRKWKLESHEARVETGYEELTVKLAEERDPLGREMLEACIASIWDAERGVDQSALQIIEGGDYAGTWRLIRAGWKRDEIGSPPQDNRLYLYKRYVRVTARSESASVTENNCTFLVSETPFDNLASLPVPPAGSSGVTYRVVRESRDPDTLRWSGAVERREQLTTRIPEYTASETAFAKVYEQRFFGLRNSAEAPDTYNLDHTGQPAEGLWTVGTGTAGTVYTQDYGKNENCTADLTQRKIVEKNVAEAVKTAGGTHRESFLSKLERSRAAATDGITEGFTAAGAPIIERTLKPTDGGKVDEEIKTRTPRAFDSHTITSQLPDGTAEYTVHFVNATSSDIAAILAGFPRYRAIPGYDWDDFRLYHGAIKFTLWEFSVARTQHYDFYEASGITETREEVVSRGGDLCKRVYTITYNLKRDEGISSGASAYSGAKSGSYFNPLKGDWYEYKKVTAISVQETALDLSSGAVSL